jgi:hypothetical protein
MALYRVGSTESGNEIKQFTKDAHRAFSSLQLIERGYSDKASISTVVMSGMVDPVSKLLKARRAKPTLCLASDQYSNLVLFGLISFDVTIPYSTHSVCNIEIEGLL